MKILFTKSEYRTLLDMIYMGEWMLTAYEEEENPAKAAYKHLAQKIYSHAKEMGWESLVESSPAENAYYPTAEYEEKSGIHALIDDYDADAFWDQLIERLTDRDVADKVEAPRLERMSHAAYNALADPIIDAYSREFAAHGVERLRIVE